MKSSYLSNLRMDVSDTSDTLTKLKGRPGFPSSFCCFLTESAIEKSWEDLERGETCVSKSLLAFLDKSEGSKFSLDFEEASLKLQDYCECLGIEVNERINIVDMLQSGKMYYAHCLTEFQRTAKVQYTPGKVHKHTLVCNCLLQLSTCGKVVIKATFGNL